MNRRLFGVFGFALVVAGFTSFLVYRLIISHVQAPAMASKARKIVVAARDLQVGALIHDYDLEEITWPAAIPSHAIVTRQDLVGRGVVATVYEKEPILDGRLAPKGAGAGLAATIPLGKRAVALRVNDVVGLAGFVLPGMRVDVLVAGNAPGTDRSSTGTLSRTALQNIEVLSAGQKIERNVDGKPQTAQVVNLLVTPDEAEVLNLASTEAKVQLVLRNPMDTKQETTRGASVASLFGVPETKPAPAPQPAKVPRPVRQIASAAPAGRDPDVGTVEVFNGAKKTEQEIQIVRENQ